MWKTGRVLHELCVPLENATVYSIGGSVPRQFNGAMPHLSHRPALEDNLIVME
jgi:hypothetical protein